MDSAALRYFYAIPFLAAMCVSASAQGVYSTTVAPTPEEHTQAPCQYELTIPRQEAAVRAVWVFFDRGREVLDLYNDAEVFRFAEQERLGLLLARHCRSKEREDMDVQPEQGIGRALLTALNQLTQTSRHGELSSTRLIAFGFSGAGSLVSRLPGFAPDRMLASIAYAPGQYEPVGMDTIQLPPAAQQIPQLVIANGADPINGTHRPRQFFTKYFEQGAPWIFAIQNGVAHHGGLANTKPLLFAWLQGVLDATPESTGVTGLTAGQRGGWWLYLRLEDTRERDDWEDVVQQAAGARVEKAGSRVPDGYIGAGWAPTKKVAAAWLDLVKKPSHPVKEKFR